jgi:large subunit ribosomal protein L3
MPKGILGRKVGMTQLFDERGHIVPVTIIHTGPNVVVRRRTKEQDGYTALQLGLGEVKERRVSKPVLGQFAKANVAPTKILREIRTEDVSGYEVGQKIGAEIFEPGDMVSVTGRSKGKGFQGSIRRHGFSRGPMSHGSKYHRGPGSLSPRDGARVFKGRKLPGHQGAVRVTVRGISVVKVDAEKSLLILKGAVPGPKGGLVVVREIILARREKV